MKRYAFQFCLTSAVFLYCLATTSLTQAQITNDGTLSTQVTTPDNLNFTINSGSRVGGNLFHSFREFSIPNEGSAFFNNPLDVDNIISRVMGSSISNINGLIRAKGSANLFLINPKGIIFGSGAKLEIGGSFVTSTANRLNFADGVFFSATDPQAQPLLTVSLPVGLQFGESAGSITNRSSVTDSDGNFVGLQVKPGKTLALVGDGVTLEGGDLTALEGRIELGSVAGPAQVRLKPIEKGWSLAYESVQNFKDIKLSQEAIVDTSSIDANGAGNGTIHLRGRQIAITGGSVVRGNTLGVQPGESLMINTSEFVEVSDSSFLQTATYGAAKAGDISIKTRRLIVNGGLIRAFTLDSGQAGNITVDAPQSVEVIRSLGSSTRGVIDTQTFSTDENAGTAGTVRITTGKLILNGGGQIATSTVGAGDGGSLIVNASQSVEVSGRSANGAFPSGLLAQSAGGEATGNAGRLEISTKQLIVQDGARISVGAVEDPRRPGVSTGQGGELRINASDSVEVIGTGTDFTGQVVPSTLLSESQGPGAAGNLTISTGNLIVRDGAEVNVSSKGTEDAGNLDVIASSIRLDNKGKLIATSASGEGGNIRLSNLDLLLLRDESRISTSAGGSGKGGNINIDTDLLVGAENSDITANAFEGEGGFIRIAAQGIFGLAVRQQLTENSDITAFSQKDPSLNGVVEINRPDVDPSAELVVLPAEIVDVSRLVSQGCPAGRGNLAQGSEFVVTGRGGLPPTPTEATRSDSVLADLGTPVQSQENHASAAIRSNFNNSEESATLVEAQGWVIGSKGEVILTASAPTVNPDIPWLTPTSCNGS